jgi:hypothetical protein
LETDDRPDRTVANASARSIRAVPCSNRETAPGITGASAGTRVRIWLASSGEPAEPPPSLSGQVYGAVILAFALTCGAGLGLLACYWLSRLALERRRLAGWQSDWALTGPRWTTRQG